MSFQNKKVFWNKKEDRFKRDDAQINLPLIIETRIPYIRGEEYTEEMLKSVGERNGNGKENVTSWLEAGKKVYTHFSIFWLSE